MGVLKDNEAEVVRMANDGIPAYAIAKHFNCCSTSAMNFLARRGFSKYNKTLACFKREYKKYYKKNNAYFKDKQKKWYKENREHKLEQNKKCREEFKKSHNGLSYKTYWGWNNSDKVSEYNRTYAEKFKLKHGMVSTTYYGNGYHILKRIQEGEYKRVFIDEKGERHVIEHRSGSSS